LSEAQSIAAVGSWEWDVRSNRVTWSDELYRIYGLDTRSFTGSFEGFLERVHRDDRDRARDEVERALEERRSFTFDHRIVRPDGTVRTVRPREEMILDKHGQRLPM